MIKVVVSGAFDPIHRGHIEYFKAAKQYGDYLIVIMRNDKGILAKKPQVFMPIEDRYAILESIKYVDEVFISIDDDGTSVESLKLINPDIYVKGGDARDNPNDIDEIAICQAINCGIVYDVVPVIQSSSYILERYRKESHGQD